jgi:hypothetical protein
MCKYFAALKLRGRVSFNDDVDLIRSLASNNGDLSRVELLRLDRYCSPTFYARAYGAAKACQLLFQKRGKSTQKGCMSRVP